MMSRCSECRYWARRPDQKKGDCLLDPPTVVEGGASFWPRTWADEVCSQFKPISLISPALRPNGLVKP